MKYTLWKILFKYTILEQKLKLEPGWGSSTWPITYSTLSKGRTSHLCGDEKYCLTWYKSWKTDCCIACSLPPELTRSWKKLTGKCFQDTIAKINSNIRKNSLLLKRKKKHVSSVTCILVVINIHFNTLYELNHCHWMLRALNTLDSTSWVDHCVGLWVIKMHQRLYSCCSSIDYSLRLQESCFPDFLDLSQFQIIQFLVKPQLLGDKGLPVLSVVVHLFPIEWLHVAQDQWITCVGEEIFSSTLLGSWGWSVNETDIR